MSKYHYEIEYYKVKKTKSKLKEEEGAHIHGHWPMIMLAITAKFHAIIVFITQD